MHYGLSQIRKLMKADLVYAETYVSELNGSLTENFKNPEFGDAA